MEVLEALKENEVKEIYDSAVVYSLLKYEELSEGAKEVLYEKYRNALAIVTDKDLDTNKDKDELKAFLENEKNIYESIKDKNQPVIDLVSQMMVNTIKEEIPKDLSNLQVCEYLFDLVTSIMNHASDWTIYFNNTPPKDNYSFEFYNGIPLSKTYPGLLVTRQGTGEDLANLYVYLGREFNIPIGVELCKYKSKYHIVNYILINDKKSYIDIKNRILYNETKEKCFLVSQETLNTNKDYIITDTTPSIDVKVPQKNYNIETLITKLNSIMPQIQYLNEPIKQTK